MLAMTMIQNSIRVFFANKEGSNPQPTKSLDYRQLKAEMSEIEKKFDVQDFRSRPITVDSIEELDSTKAIDKKSIIPIPGLLIPTENNESGWKPPSSDWVAPHGPQWGPMTQ